MPWPTTTGATESATTAVMRSIAPTKTGPTQSLVHARDRAAAPPPRHARNPVHARTLATHRRPARQAAPAKYWKLKMGLAGCRGGINGMRCSKRPANGSSHACTRQTGMLRGQRQRDRDHGSDRRFGRNVAFGRSRGDPLENGAMVKFSLIYKCLKSQRCLDVALLAGSG